MKKILLTLILTLVSVYAVSQTSMTSVLSLNQEREYKTKRPQKIVETNIFYNSSGKQIEKNTKTFDEAGMLLLEERTDETGNLITRLTYVNDTINRLKLSRTVERWTKLRGYSKETAYISYDENKFLVNWTDKDINGKTRYETVISCNTQGDPIEISLIDGNGNPFGKETATYNYDSNEVIIKIFSNKGIQLSERTTTINPTIEHLFKKDGYIYNEQGDIIKFIDAVTRTGYSYEYTYDTYGNSTEQKIYKITFKKNGKEKRTIDRIFRKTYVY